MIMMKDSVIAEDRPVTEVPRVPLRHVHCCSRSVFAGAAPW